MRDDLHYCHRCKRETTWVPTRRGAKREKCLECGDTFPCPRACKHLDCAREKKSA